MLPGKFPTAAIPFIMVSIVGSLQPPSSGDNTLPDPPDRELSEIDSFVQAGMACRRIPGLSLTVVRASRILMERGYGWADRDLRRDVNPSTLFPIASLTKAFSVTLLAILLEESPKNYTWDTRVKTILGDSFEMYDDILTSQCTLRDLIAHKTGVGEFFLPIMAGFPLNSTLANTSKRIKYHKPTHGFRSKFMYNNIMYAVVGHVTEVLAGGEKWENLMRKRIFDPLGMTSSTFAQQSVAWETLATPYVIYGGEIRKIDKGLIRQTNGIGPAGAILTTGRDMVKWLQFHLQGGLGPDGRRLLSEEALKATYKEEMPNPTPMSDRNLFKPQFPIGDVHIAYDLGWITNMYRGYRRVWHSGGIASYKTLALLYPELDLAMHAVLNGPPTKDSTWGITLFMMYVSDVFLREQPWLNTSTLCSFPEPWGRNTEPQEPETPLPPLVDDPRPNPATYYEGTFSHPGFGEVRVQEDNTTGKLMFSMGELMEGILHYNAQQDVFYTNMTGSYWYATDQVPVQFKVLPAQGTIVHLHMPLYAPYNTAEPTTFFRNGYYYNIEPGPSVNTWAPNSSLSVSGYWLTGVLIVSATVLVVIYH